MSLDSCGNRLSLGGAHAFLRLGSKISQTLGVLASSAG